MIITILMETDQTSVEQKVSTRPTTCQACLYWSGTRRSQVGGRQPNSRVSGERENHGPTRLFVLSGRRQAADAEGARQKPKTRGRSPRSSVPTRKVPPALGLASTCKWTSSLLQEYRMSRQISYPANKSRGGLSEVLDFRGTCPSRSCIVPWDGRRGATQGRSSPLQSAEPTRSTRKVVPKDASRPRREGTAQMFDGYGTRLGSAHNSRGPKV